MKKLILFLISHFFLNLAGASQPNILWIITDDQRADSIAAFNKMMTGSEDSALGPVSSPNVDQLAAEGSTFINTYCQSSACAPSRAAMHSGQYPHHSGVYGFETHHTNNKAITKPIVPAVMAKAGYQTSVSGKLGERTLGWDGQKWDWNMPKYDQYIGPFKEMARAGYSDWRAEGVFGNEPGRVETFYFGEGKQMEIFNPKKGDMDAENKAVKKSVEAQLDLLRHYYETGEEQSMIIGGVSPRKAGETRDGYYVKALKDFLGHANSSYKSGWGETYRGANTSKPQFINLGFDFPHTPVLPPASYRKKFSKITYKIPRPAEGELKSFPAQIKALHKAKGSDHLSEDELQTMIQDYYAFCAYGDSLVGEAVDAFRAYSEKNKQPWMILFVCGDHGWRLNEHGSIAKFGPWATDSHDPIVVVSSDKNKFPAGKVVSDFTEFVDMAPTFYAASGLDLDTPQFEYLDGYDLAEVVSGAKEARDYVLNEGWWVSGPRATIRTKDFMFSMKVKEKRVAGPVGDILEVSLQEIEPLLYDLKNDPGETQNLALDERYSGIAKQMRKKLQDIVLGDGRIEVNWAKGLEGKVYSSNFAPGSDDKKLNLNF